MADVDAALKDWSPTSSNNKPTGATTIGTGLDDNLRELQGAIIRGLSYKGADIASATTADLGAIEGLMHDITGTTTITSFGTVRQGLLKVIKFEGALTLTHNGTSLVLPGGANITTADGDIALFISEGSGNWRCISYFKAGSLYSTLAGTETLTNKTLTSPVISGGTVNNAAIGGTTPAAGAFTTLSASGQSTLAATSFDYTANGSGFRSNGFCYITQTSNTVFLLNRKGTTGTVISVNYEDSSVGSVSTDGVNTAYNTSSDYRLKDAVVPLSGSGQFIDSLQPKQWVWKKTGSPGTGFIAHEVQQVSPGSVIGDKDAVDEDGNPIYQAMEYGSAEFIANIVAELQSLRSRVAALEA